MEDWAEIRRRHRAEIRRRHRAEIRRRHRAEGVSIKEIARGTGLARNTVRTAVRSR